jgi:hypothetical protein
MRVIILLARTRKKTQRLLLLSALSAIQAGVAQPATPPASSPMLGAFLKTPSTGVNSVDFEGFRIWACSVDTGVMWEFLGAVFQSRSQWDLDV